MNVTVSSVDAGLRGAAYSDHLRHTMTDGRVIVTRDVHFLRMHADGVAHAGIVYASADRTIGELVRGCVVIWELMIPEEMKNHEEFL